MSVRIDKFCWCVRLSKTRSLATELITKGKIKLNGGVIKPSKEPKVGDVISLQKNTAQFTFQILEILDKRVGAKLVEHYLRDITPDTEKEKYRNYQLAQQTYRQNGTGKPSKKDRKDLEDFLDW